MLDYIRSLISLVFVISLGYILLECKIRNKRQFYLLVLYTILWVFCDGLILYNLGYVGFRNYYPLLVHVPIILAFLFLSDFKAIKVFFIFFTTLALALSVSLIGLIISYFFGFNRVLFNVVCFVVYPPTWFIVYRYIRPSFLYMLRNTDKGWLGFCVIPLSFSTLVFFTSKYNLDTVITERAFVFSVLLFILTLAAYVLILRFFQQTREQITLQNEQNLLQAQVAAAHLYLDALQESQNTTIIYRHDMRHHLNLIKAYLADNHQDTAQNYITEVEKTIAEVEVEKYCNNYTVNLILYSYITKAKDEEIAVETRIDLPTQTAVSDMDLCVIFANAIENAVNACKLIPNASDRIIKILCKTQNDKLFIQFTNRYAGSIMFADDMPISSEENHGLGTKSIAAIAKKYGGVSSFSAEGGVFKTSIIL